MEDKYLMVPSLDDLSDYSDKMIKLGAEAKELALHSSRLELEDHILDLLLKNPIFPLLVEHPLLDHGQICSVANHVCHILNSGRSHVSLFATTRYDLKTHLYIDKRSSMRGNNATSTIIIS